jgi:hypothetical protein
MPKSLSEHERFVVRELWILAWSASVQRAKLYNPDVKTDGKAKARFQDAIVDYIEKDLILCYQRGCSEETHYNNIQLLICEANRIGDHILGPRGYKYGAAQKLLNLGLKYLWCLGHIQEPPHCPLDRIIIGKTRFKGKVNWTEITARSQYEPVINAIKALAFSEGITPAVWELRQYARRAA